jgi:hypothetical protein
MDTPTETCACAGTAVHANTAAKSTHTPSAHALQRVAVFRKKTWHFMKSSLA